MTYEYAVFFKILLLCGYKDDMEQYLDTALVEQNPLSNIVLELSLTGNDDKKKLSVLNEYLLQVKDSDIDYERSVFELVMVFLKRKYINENMSMKGITDLMYKIALYTKRYLDEPWNTMYLMGDLFSEAEAGYIDKDDYQRKFNAFLNNNVCLCDYPPILPKESFLKKRINKIFGNK
ncbi:MAG: hypothetical protein J1E05_07535 [Eubacterium sp.]|nr:hypothetical protein [Eubacterium sp.]